MRKTFSDRIIEFLRRPGYEPLRTHKLARAMGVADAEMGDFRDAVNALRHVGRIVIGANSAVMLQQTPSQVVGTFRANPRGFGFVVPDEVTEHGDLYIAQGDSADAVTGDRVLCEVMSRGKREGRQAFGGRVIKVVERGNNRFVGVLKLEGTAWYVEADGNTMHGPVLIGDPHAKGARAGDQVVFEIVKYPRDGRPAGGVIVERLGQRGEPGVDLVAIMRQYHLPEEFPEGALDDARRMAREYDADEFMDSREVLEASTIITIDPDDARDFDDAISLERMHKSHFESRRDEAAQWQTSRSKHGPAAWELGVHIADVSTFVRLGSELDREARTRGTSVYLPGRVIPMLPEILSNGLCSLQEGEPRLCKSAFIRYDAEGRVVAARFANTVIKSNKRLTYGEAQKILDGSRGGFEKPVVDLVTRMDKLARAIRKRRIDDGMIVLDLPAVDLIYDEDGRVIDAQPEDTSFSHTIIEMFMVEANEAVARRLSSLDAPFLRRVHAPPEEESVAAMAMFLRAAGQKLPKKVEPRDLQKALDNLRGKPEGYAVNLAVLKSMQSAEYSPREIGHFALASEDYAHFTSPIRRYPDLMVHRLLDLYFDGRLPAGKKRGDRTPAGLVSFDELVEEGRRMSYLSRRAESAERELKTLKVLTILDRQLGETFEGVVTGVTNFGLFVQHPKYLIDGLVRLEDLGDDWWDVDVKQARVRGQRSNRSYTLGTRVSVEIGEVNLGMRQLTLLMAERSKSGSGRRKEGARGRENGDSHDGKTPGVHRPKGRGEGMGTGRSGRQTRQSGRGRSGANRSGKRRSR